MRCSILFLNLMDKIVVTIKRDSGIVDIPRNTRLVD